MYFLYFNDILAKEGVTSPSRLIIEINNMSRNLSKKILKKKHVPQISAQLGT